MDERPPTVPVANQRDAAPRDLLDKSIVEHTGAGTVESAIPKHDTAYPGCLGDRVFEMTNQIEGAAQLLRWLAVQRVPSDLTGPPTLAKGHPQKLCAMNRLTPVSFAAESR